MKIRINLEWDVDIDLSDEVDVYDAVQNMLAQAGQHPFGSLLRKMSYTVEEVPPWEQFRDADLRR